MLLKVVGDGECCSGVVGGVVPGLARRGGDGACPNARAWASWLSLERGMAVVVVGLVECELVVLRCGRRERRVRLAGC